MNKLWKKFDGLTQTCYSNMAQGISDIDAWNAGFDLLKEIISNGRTENPDFAKELYLLDDETDYSYDVQGWLEDYLDELKKNKNFAKSIKVAIGIDDEKSKSSLTMLKNFTGDEDYVIKTDKIRGRLAELIHNMTIQVSRASITEQNDEAIKKAIVQFKR